MAIELHVGNGLDDPLMESISQAQKMILAFLEIPLGDLAGLSQSHDVRNVLRPGPTVALLSSSMDERGYFCSPADKLSADSLGSVQFVAGKGENVYGQLLQVDGDFSHGLHAVGVKEDPFLPGHLPDFLHGENRPRLIIGKHNTDQNRLRL